MITMRRICVDEALLHPFFTPLLKGIRTDMRVEPFCGDYESNFPMSRDDLTGLIVGEMKKVRLSS